MRRRLSWLFAGFFAPFLMIAQPILAGDGGDGSPPPNLRICRSGPSAGLECMTDDDCPGGACVDTHFLPDLPRICKGGPSNGDPCTQRDDCVKGKCVIDFTETTPAAIPAIVTIITDDDETHRAVGYVPCGATTMLLEFQKGARHYHLAQNYVCLPIDNRPEVEFVRTENGLNAAASGEDPFLLVNRVLFRAPDGGPLDEAYNEISQKLRDIFQTTGRPIAVSTQKMLDESDHTDNGDNRIASVARFKITFRFVK